jgi:hypothetical protein
MLRNSGKHSKTTQNDYRHSKPDRNKLKQLEKALKGPQKLLNDFEMEQNNFKTTLNG